MGSFNYGEQKSKNSNKVWGEQSPYLTDLYAQAQSQYQNGSPYTAMGQSYGQNFLANNNIYGNTNNAWQQSLGGGQSGQIASATAGNTSNALNSFLQGPQQNPYLQQNVQGALGDMATVFNRDVMPGIRGGAAAAGQPGSSREGIAQGVAMGDLSKNMLNTASGMYGQAYDQDRSRQLQAAGMSGNIAGQAGQQQLGAIGQGQGVYNLGFSPVSGYSQLGNMGWQDLQNYAGLIGGPTILGSGSSSGYSVGGSYGSSSGGTKP